MIATDERLESIRWTDDETRLLLNIWNEKTIQDSLSKKHNTSKIYEFITDKLKENGYQRTVQQVVYRVKNLKKSFKQVSDFYRLTCLKRIKYSLFIRLATKEELQDRWQLSVTILMSCPKFWGIDQRYNHHQRIWLIQLFSVSTVVCPKVCELLSLKNVY